MDALWTGGFAGLWVSQSKHRCRRPMEEWGTIDSLSTSDSATQATHAESTHPAQLKNTSLLWSDLLITARKWEKKLFSNVKKTASLSASPLPRSHCKWGAAASGARCIMAQLFFCNPSLPWVTSLTTLASEFFVGPTYWYADFGYYQVQPATQWHCSICLHVG